MPGNSSYDPHGLAVGDITGDGWPDLVIAAPMTGLVILRNLHPSPPSPSPSASDSGVSVSLAGADPHARAHPHTQADPITDAPAAAARRRP